MFPSEAYVMFHLKLEWRQPIALKASFSLSLFSPLSLALSSRSLLMNWEAGFCATVWRERGGRLQLHTHAQTSTISSQGVWTAQTTRTHTQQVHHIFDWRDTPGEQKGVLSHNPKLLDTCLNMAVESSQNSVFVTLEKIQVWEKENILLDLELKLGCCLSSCLPPENFWWLPPRCPLPSAGAGTWVCTWGYSWDCCCSCWCFSGCSSSSWGTRWQNPCCSLCAPSGNLALSPAFSRCCE